MTILVTENRGSLGDELQKKLKDVIIPTAEELDLTNKKSISNFFQKNDIDTIIHNASLYNVRICEEQKTEAMKINVQSTRNLVDIISSIKPIQFIHISTPCVFDGKHNIYAESSIPYPVNFYGLTRLLAEYEVAKLSEYLIVRTNFVERKKWPYPQAFVDRFGTYLFVDQAAEGIHDVQKENLHGIVHIVGDRKISLYDLAKITTPDVKSITLDEYSGPPLNVNMSLDTERWKKYKL